MFTLEGLSLCPYIDELIQLSVYSWQTRLAHLVQVEIEWIFWRWMRREFFMEGIVAGGHIAKEIFL